MYDCDNEVMDNQVNRGQDHTGDVYSMDNKVSEGANVIVITYPNKHNTLIQCCFHVGPAS